MDYDELTFSWFVRTYGVDLKNGIITWLHEDSTVFNQTHVDVYLKSLFNELETARQFIETMYRENNWITI